MYIVCAMHGKYKQMNALITSQYLDKYMYITTCYIFPFFLVFPFDYVYD